jgi:hypothetical protein
MQQGVQQAKAELSKLGQRLNELGGGSDGLEIPGFKPNHQKTKSFLKKMEFSAEVQSGKTNNLFPASSDFGLSAGYKPTDKLVVGIGGSYRMGWGSGFTNMRITHQGVGIRSFIEWKIKGKLFLSGGYEQNYYSEIKRLRQLANHNGWKESALLGVDKKYSIGKKKNGQMKILYDFFSQNRVPATSPLIFRMGFGL